MSGMKPFECDSIHFSHIQMYVDKLEDLIVYQQLEEQLKTYREMTTNTTAAAAIKAMDDNPKGQLPLTISKQQLIWTQLTKQNEELSDASYTAHDRDIVKQMMVGFGFSIAGTRYRSDAEEGMDPTTNTRTVLLTSCDPRGVKFLVTAAIMDPNHTTIQADPVRMFDAERVKLFFDSHNHRQGIGVLAFDVDNVNIIRERYNTLHPALVSDYSEYMDGSVLILEVYAYYQVQQEGGMDNSTKTPDRGTVLRFIQSKIGKDYQIPGINYIESTVGNESSMPAYFDHWVSNVFSRTEFLDTLNDTLGFTPKVDFNAGIVAAGEAQIESTVTGNQSKVPLSAHEVTTVLSDQSQVYLPINNALSSIGHVHGFLKEMGQGIQHIASRVEDLVQFVQGVNERRMIMGEGFSFLRIPRSYYGVVSASDLVQAISASSTTSSEEAFDCADSIVNALVHGNFIGKEGDLKLDTSCMELEECLGSTLDGAALNLFRERKDTILSTILQSRYKNLYALLGDKLSEEQYIGIVRNQVLVDIQAGDLLLQIFTSNILQRNPDEEAPFLEFIQRVCGDKKKQLRPGCGGFGIRNFLTLFLSIEVSKAMVAVTTARESGDVEGMEYFQTMVDMFTMQLNESNPILTQISETMTEEGWCREKMLECLEMNDKEGASVWEKKMDSAAELKNLASESLLKCSSHFNDLMKRHREERPQYGMSPRAE